MKITHMGPEEWCDADHEDISVRRRVELQSSGRFERADFVNSRLIATVLLNHLTNNFQTLLCQNSEYNSLQKCFTTDVLDLGISFSAT